MITFVILATVVVILAVGYDRERVARGTRPSVGPSVSLPQQQAIEQMKMRAGRWSNETDPS